VNAHSVSLVTGYHRLLSTKADLQHLLPGAAHALPQHWPPPPWHGKLSPFTFSQQRSPIPTQTSPQQRSPPAHWNWFPCRFQQTLGGNRRRVSESWLLRKDKSELSSLPHSPSAEHSSPSATAELPKSAAIAKTRPTAILKILRCDSRLSKLNKVA